MRRNTHAGKFIVFEGLDGSGKSTQARLAWQNLIDRGLDALLTREPVNDSAAGKQIRSIVEGRLQASPAELQELCAADRKEHLETLIVPALRRGSTVISDRYCFSSFAFGAIDLDLEWLISINEDFLLPDLAVLLKVGTETCLARIRQRGIGRTLFETKEALSRAWRTYEMMPSRFSSAVIVDGEGSREEVFTRVEAILSRVLPKTA